VCEGDFIIPITAIIKNGTEAFASQSEAIEVRAHLRDGLIPSVMDALTTCSFFYAGHDRKTVYGTGSIVSIRNI